jgi:hypothetical protein
VVRRYASLRFKWEINTLKFAVNARDLQAMISASITNRAVIVELVDQPTTRRGWKFIATAGRGRPSAVQMRDRLPWRRCTCAACLLVLGFWNFRTDLATSRKSLRNQEAT